jgi:excisionase family DNA binding protein
VPARVAEIVRVGRSNAEDDPSQGLPEALATPPVSHRSSFLQQQPTLGLNAGGGDLTSDTRQPISRLDALQQLARMLARQVAAEFYKADCASSEEGGPTMKWRPPAATAATPAEPSVRLLTVAQAAKAIQLSERQVRRMIAKGEIQHRRFGRVIRIHPRDLGL